MNTPTFEQFESRYREASMYLYSAFVAIREFKDAYPPYEADLDYNYYSKKIRDENEFLVKNFPRHHIAEWFIKAVTSCDFEQAINNWDFQ